MGYSKKGKGNNNKVQTGANSTGGIVNVQDLAEEFGTTGRKIRKVLRAGGMTKSQYFWTWASNSKDLREVENYLRKNLND